MKIFVAEDDPICRRILETSLVQWGHEAVTARDGDEAWRILQAPDAPRLAILDWLMPGLEGVEVCRKVREARPMDSLYFIILTVKGGRENLLTGLDAGADDYMVKPFDKHELRARIQAGVRILNLQERLTQRIHTLEVAMARIRVLQGLLPICAWCKKVRDDSNYWQRVDAYIAEHSDLRFTHCICPECKAKEVAKLQSAKAVP